MTKIFRRPRKSLLLLLGRVILVLLEFSVKSLASDAERACGARLVAFGVIERCLYCLSFYLVHCGRDVYLKLNRATFVCGLRTLTTKRGALVQNALADCFRQIVQLNL